MPVEQAIGADAGRGTPRMRRTTRPSPQRGGSVAFGLERVGLLAHRHPLIASAVLAVIAAVSIYGLFHLTIDRNLRDLFRSDTPEYQAYLETATAFTDPENQILVLLQGTELTTPEGLQHLLDLHLDLQLLPDVGSVYSLFSLRTAPDAEGGTAPIVSDRSQGLTPDLIAAIREHPLMGRNLLSADGSALVFFISNAEPRASLRSQQALIDAVQMTVRDAFAGTSVHTAVTGLAAVRAEIVALLKRDQLVLNGSGILIGFVLSFIFFRSVAAALMTAVPAMLAGLTLIGWTGTLGVPVTIVSNVVPVLVMILGYADGMHLTAAWRRARDRGLSVRAAERSALREAAAPCMLTALTMAVAFLSMTLSHVTMVRNFGLMGAVGSVAGTWIILAAHAIGGMTIGRFWRRDGHVAKTPLGWLAAPAAGLTRLVVKRAWPIALLSIPLTIVFGVLFLAVPPDYSVRETLPSNGEAAEALSVVDTALGGAFPVEIVLPMPADHVLSPEGLATIRAVHEAAASVPGVESSLSLWSLAEWLGDDVPRASEDLSRLLDQLPQDTRTRLLGTPGALVTVNITELRTTETLALVNRIESAVEAIDPQAFVTGATVVGARESNSGNQSTQQLPRPCDHWRIDPSRLRHAERVDRRCRHRPERPPGHGDRLHPLFHR